MIWKNIWLVFSEWFLHNGLKANANKFHLFVSLFIDKTMSNEDFDMKSSNAEVPSQGLQFTAT